MLDWRSLRPVSIIYPIRSAKPPWHPYQIHGCCHGSAGYSEWNSSRGNSSSEDGTPLEKIIQPVPMKRWAQLEELDQTMLFLLDGPEYITGEIIHLDGGRHLV